MPGSVDAFIASGRSYFYVIDNPETPEYGHTILSKAYVMSHWPRYAGMEVVEYVEGAIEAYPEGCQDLVLLAKAIG